MDDSSAPVVSVRVVYSGLLRHVLSAPEETVSIPHGSTLRELLEVLAQRHGEPFREAMFVGVGQIVPNAIVLLDGVDAQQRGGLDTAIHGQTAAQVLLMTAACGGG